MRQLGYWSQGKNFFRKLQALPLLPANQMIPAFEWLRLHASPAIIEFFADFLIYMRRQWLTIVSPQNLSVFGLDLRTTNPIEAYHGTLIERIGFHPTIWRFIRKYNNNKVYYY